MENSDEKIEQKMAGLNLDTEKISSGFALVIVNEEFKRHKKRNGAEHDRSNIVEFCKRAKFTVNDVSALKLKDTSNLAFDSQGLKTDNLTAKQMEDLFKTISKGDFSRYDAFICFISSHGDEGCIFGSDDGKVSFQEIVDYFKASNESPTLTGKPKLFFTQNCRGGKSGEGIPVPANNDHVSDHVETDNDYVPTVPSEADILIAYSSVNGFESYRNPENGSWFITELMRVFNEHAEEMNLTDMLTIVNKVVAQKESENGEKQMPCVSSTLRKAVYFDVSEASESPSSSEEPPPANPSL